MSSHERLENISMKFVKACDQIKLIKQRISELINMFSYDSNNSECSLNATFKETIRQQIDNLQNIKNAYFLYAHRKADEINKLQCKWHLFLAWFGKLSAGHGHGQTFNLVSMTCLDSRAHGKRFLLSFKVVLTETRKKLKVRIIDELISALTLQAPYLSEFCQGNNKTFKKIKKYFMIQKASCTAKRQFNRPTMRPCNRQPSIINSKCNRIRTPTSIKREVS